MITPLSVSIILFLGLASFATVLQEDVKDDYNKWRGAIEVKHKVESVTRFIAMILAVACFWVLPAIHNHWAFAILLMAWLLTSWYWLLFDGWYNRKRGFDWWYPGSEKGKTDDSFFDKLLRRLPKDGIAKVKIGYVIVATVLYIVFSL